MRLYEKGTPLELTLSPFHDSLKMKRLPSDLAIFTLVKVFELMHPPSDSLTLFSVSLDCCTKKALREFSFECFSKLYNLEKPSSLLSLDSLNKH
jgi:hypothetical protein